MKLIIAGGRDYNLTVREYGHLNYIHTKYQVTEVVSGGCRGVDKCGERWADKHDIPIKVFPYKSHLGKRGGPARNREMAEYADALVLFKGGRGSKNMYQTAVRLGLKIFDLR